MIDHKNLKALIKLMVDNDLTELDLHDPQGERITLKRAGGSAAGVPAMLNPAVLHHLPAAVHPHSPAPPSIASAPSPSGPRSEGADDGLVPIPSPIVGTFYASATPDAKAFIAAGDVVNPDTVVCIIEAMKVFNEIKAEMSGVVERVLASNGRAVEFGQPLFMIRPT